MTYRKTKTILLVSGFVVLNLFASCSRYNSISLNRIVCPSFNDHQIHLVSNINSKLYSNRYYAELENEFSIISFIGKIENDTLTPIDVFTITEKHDTTKKVFGTFNFHKYNSVYLRNDSSHLGVIQLLTDSISTYIDTDGFIKSISQYQNHTTVMEGIEVKFYKNQNIKSFTKYRDHIPYDFELNFDNNGSLISQQMISPKFIKYHSGLGLFYNQDDEQISLTKQQENDFFNLMIANKLIYAKPYFILITKSNHRENNLD